MRVLYVDSDPDGLSLVGEALRKTASHIELDAVTSLAEARERLDSPEPPYDLLLCDTRLPDGSGLELLSDVRSRRLPLAVVLTTASADEESVVTGLKSGADDYLIKGPDFLQRLPQTLEAALARFRAGEAFRQQPLRVLYAERSSADVELTRLHLQRRAPYIQLEAVGSGPEVLALLPEKGPECAYDLLLLDYRLPGMNAIDLLKEVRARGFDLPVVIVTGHGGQEIALQALKMGAADYLVKAPGYLERLPWAIENAVHQARLLREQAALRESEARFRALLEAAPDALVTTDAQGRIVLWNTAAEALLGWSTQEIVGQEVTRLVPEEQQARYMQTGRCLIDQCRPVRAEIVARHKDGTEIPCEISASAWRSGAQVYFTAFLHDIRARKRAQEEIERRVRELEALFQVAQAASRHEKVRDLLEEIAGIACSVIPAAEQGVVFLRDGPGAPFSAQIVLSKAGRASASSYRPAVEVYRAVEKGVPAVLEEIAPSMAPGSLPVPQSALVAPLHARERCAGAIVLENFKPRAFTQADLQLLVAIAASAGVAMERIRLLEETQRRASELSVLHTIAALGVTAEDEDSLIEQATEAIAQALYHENVGVFLLDAERNVLCPHPSFRAISEVALHVEVPLGTGITGHVAVTGEPYRTGDVTNDPFYLMVLPETRSEMCAPLRVGDRTLGVIDVQSSRPDAFSEEDERLLATVGSQLAAAIERVRALQETRIRAEELAILARIEAALRRPTTLAGTLSALAEQLHETLKVSATAICLYDRERKDLLIAHASGEWAELRGHHLVKDGKTREVIARGEPYLSEKGPPEEMPVFPSHRIPSVCVPLVAEGDTIGALWAGARGTWTPAAVRRLAEVGRSAAGTIRHMMLLEETERHLRRISALHAAEQAITMTLDLRVTLQALLSHVARYLEMDAAAILLFNEKTLLLEYAAGLGFPFSAGERMRFRLGEGPAGQVALERRPRRIVLEEQPEVQAAVQQISGERFAACDLIPLIAKGQLKGVLQVFYRTSPPEDPGWQGFLQTLAGQAAIAIDNVSLFESLQQSHMELTLAYDAALEGWIRSIDLRNREAPGHTQRVTEAAVRLARALGISGEDLFHLRRGALLHDVGMLAVPERVLLKPGPLDAEEMELVRRHPQHAYEILYPVPYLRAALAIPYGHHERWNGSGYPQGLKGKEIPLPARIFAVVDVWDALLSERPYRPPWPREQALEYLRQGAGELFDPEVVEAFFRLLPEL